MHVVAGFGEAVAAEFFEQGVGEDEREHRFDDDAGGGHDADIGAFVVRLDALAGVEVGGGQRGARAWRSA